MKQFENYISRMSFDGIKSAIIFPYTEDFYNIIPLLKKYTNVENIYCVLPSGTTLTKSHSMLYSYKVEICNIFDIMERGLSADMLLFDFNRAEDIENLTGHPVKYIIGRMAAEEDYFSFWENHRGSAQHIYIKYKHEILEWSKLLTTDIELSVVLPVYNVAAYLPKCIESLTQWKAPYAEYLFVDDGSTDESAAIVSQYAKKDPRICLIQKKNGGCASARNKGIESAKGRYIGFVDTDDFISNNMFRNLLKRALLGNYDYTYSGYQEYYEDTGQTVPVIADCLSGRYLLGEYNPAQVRLLTVNTRVAIWRGLYKKSVLDRHRIRFHEELRMFDDLPFRTEYLFVAKSAVCIPEYLYNYRVGRQGQDTSCTDNRLFVHFQIFKLLDKFTAKYKDQMLWDILQAVKIQTHAYGCGQIEKKYRRKYEKLARKQLKEHAWYVRNVVICQLYAGRGSIGWLTRMWLKFHI